MAYKPKFIALLLLPTSRSYLQDIIAQLSHTDCRTIIETPLKKTFKAEQPESIVKSYFWAARTINNCQCLPRSIAIYHHLKFLGYEAKHKFGVDKKTGKLNAHSWVELNNKPLNEHPELYKRFAVLTARTEKTQQN